MHVTSATDITDSLYKLLRMHKKATSIQKYFENNSSADSELSKAQTNENIQLVIDRY